VDFLPEGGRGFAVDAGFRTPWQDVYAAGDVTTPSGRHYFNWLRSWRHGEAVADAMAAPLVEGELPVTKAEVDILNMSLLGLSLAALGQTTVAYRSGYTEMRGDFPVGEVDKKLVFDVIEAVIAAHDLCFVDRAHQDRRRTAGALRRGLTYEQGKNRRQTDPHHACFPRDLRPSRQFVKYCDMDAKTACKPNQYVHLAGVCFVEENHTRQHKRRLRELSQTVAWTGDSRPC
jgi:hypothetical protein